MKYINATEVLPLDLLSEIQKYIAGEVLYIPQPKGLKNSWGSRSGARQEIINRNKQIKSEKEDGRSIEELMMKYNLSYDTIKKIVYLK
ncbi:CD3324 family protein [Clostridium cellulovorans]|uniref:Helix-turn-helix domain of resolvase n=1 Tax=Clostridium cellulovorans (strain ATCC 35296 / DSM 3052 / OCM 3 / 743B) TaxID=573061 RepID=D9SNW8_CLOC7|nr:CD3324 family protein [Clostridium cellulovorans]ADL49989.1 helix-turn-helix domain of resolvase [Clostridium cellulovorans 743B]